MRSVLVKCGACGLLHLPGIVCRPPALVLTRSFDCRGCGLKMHTTATEEAARRGEPPWTMTCGVCGSGYQILSDRVHFFREGRRLTLTPLPIINNGVTLLPLPIINPRKP